MEITKLEAARRQLDVAIRLLFDGEEVASHTLAGAASNILSDLVEIKCPERSWDKYAQQDNQIDAKTHFRIMRMAQNFLKHAKEDSEGALDFVPADTDHLIVFASLNLGELNSPEEMNSMPVSIFQLWYFASSADRLGRDHAIVKESQKLFPDLHSLSRQQQLARGKEVLRQHESETMRP